MNIPVLWISNREDTPCHHFADQGLLKAILDRELWQPARGVSFVHQDVHNDWPDVEGAVVIVPCRYWWGAEEELAEKLDALSWSVVILTGDEEWVFDWEKIPQTETRRVWIMEPLAKHKMADWKLPAGWYPKTRDYLDSAYPPEKDLDWFFCGQVTNPRRIQCADILRTMPHGIAIETDHYFATDLPPAQYFAHMARAQAVPCPSGPVHVNSARPFEALEAGAIPFLDMIRNDRNDYDYWSLVLGENHPFPLIRDWVQFRDNLRTVLDDFYGTSARCSAWWQGYKRDTAYKLEEDIAAVSGHVVESTDPNDLITVIVTTSPIESHPDMSHIDTVVRSVRDELPFADIIIACDGVRPEDEDLRADYEEYLYRLAWECNYVWDNTVLVISRGFVHQADLIANVMHLVKTPLILPMEHDTPIHDGGIDWAGICRLVTSGKANCIRLHHEGSVLEPHRHLMLDAEPQDVEGVPLIRTKCWSQRPHITSKRFYENVVLPRTTGHQTFIEDQLYGIMLCDVDDHGEAAWWDWRVYLYAPGPHMQRSYHTDGRGARSKHL